MQLRHQNTFSCGLLLSCAVAQRSKHAGHMWSSVSAYEAQSCPHIVNSRGQGAGPLSVFRGVWWDMGTAALSAGKEWEAQRAGL